ncbi:PREDICTED: uncharacterized protein LOC104612733 isoform X2 [Nelumbo nucifera]|uniref:Uncharacterized protein LOC104612733 isoform X2 n=1 Tax=Nelumbo nucifera TaxID=4432 RepID=A0A1U8QBE3_NELNU|nr:PREDICTED: uncharacterized protein LOC104612733 isoform X2 [Nelumbo nucifera]
METFLLQEKYRCDRRKLLDFILSAGLIKEFRTPSGPVGLSAVDLDKISVDYVLECIGSGGVLDLSEATKKYNDEFRYPAMVVIHFCWSNCHLLKLKNVIKSPSKSYYFLISDPEMSGSPPQNAPPQVELKMNLNYSSCSLNQLDPLVVEETQISGDEDGAKYKVATFTPCEHINDANVLSLGLPMLSTGLSDDDLRETAYEILVASVIFSGGQVCSFEEKKKEKKSHMLSRLRSKRDKLNSQSQTAKFHFELPDIIRVQMQVSEAMDTCIKQRLLVFTSRTRPIDVPQISLELLNGIFKSDFLIEKSYKQWRKRQANILEEILYYSATHTAAEHMTIRSFLAKVRNTEEWNVKMPSEFSEALLAIQKFTSKLSLVPGKFGITGETYYWTADYHLNLKLYEKLLCSVFDILEDGQLVEEVDEILRFIRLTWSTLGITERIHDALYAWVLFQKFVETGEPILLEYAILEMQKVLSIQDDNAMEGAYMNSLICSIGINGCKMNISLVDAIFMSTSIWCDSKLQDYHLHFAQNPTLFGSVVTLVTVVGILSADEYGEFKLIKPSRRSEMASRYFKEYVEKSIQAAYKRVVDTLDAKSKVQRQHPLAVLADEVKIIVERESSVFSPVLCQWFPEAGIISSMMLHELYGARVKPFLDGVSLLTEDVRSVLPAANMLDNLLTQLCYVASGEDKFNSPFTKDMKHYQIDEISGPIILDWLSAQYGHILEWTERAFSLEDWQPLSFQQRQAASIIEIFRIIEETVHQFFSLNIPMDIIHLQSLVYVIFKSLELYLLNMINQLVDKNHLFPAVPALTRYKETMVPIIKKKLIQSKFVEEEVLEKLNELTIPKLCVRLNTLQYTQHQVGMLEDGIRKSWMLVKPCLYQRWKKEQLPGPLKEGITRCFKSVDEIFTAFNSIKKTTVGAIDKICDFIGARVVFWDLRDSFLLLLYRGDIESACLDGILPQLNSILDYICDLIIDILRDMVILSVCRASLEGFVWVLLDGGPSRAFSETDFQFMQEDLDILKDFFVANGEGLPRAVVEQEARLASQIINLFSLQTETVIGMLMTASEQISTRMDQWSPGSRSIEDAHTLIRVLCHKKDREASKFLKKQYQLPKSSEYDGASKDSISVSPLVSDLLKRSGSFRWTGKGKRSFKFIKKKIQASTSEIRQVTW